MPIDVANPGDSSLISAFPANERSHRLGIQGIWTNDHDEDTGDHEKIGFEVIGADPTLDGTLGFLYVKTVTGRTELFWEDDAGNVKQLTNVGKINVSGKVDDTGDTMTGDLVFSGADVVLENTDALRAEDSGGTEQHLASISAGDVVLLGDVSYPAEVSVDDEDGLTVEYGSGSKAIWHAGKAPPHIWVSGAIALPAASGSMAQQTHDMTRRPDTLFWKFVCTSADHGYSVGDEIHGHEGGIHNAGSSQLGMSFYCASATTIDGEVASSFGPAAISLTTNSVNSLVPAKWDIVITAIWWDP